MSSLVKRATPSQALLLRAVAGAVRNAHHAHPHWQLDRSAPSSIAKRAVGTLGALLPMLADRGQSSALITPVPGQSKPAVVSWTAGRGRSRTNRPPPLPTLHREVGKMIRRARRDGQDDVLEALVIVARMIGKMRGQT